VNIFKRKAGVISTAGILLILTGCLISGTFVLSVMIRDLQVSANGENYYINVDITEDQDWQDHQGNIKDIDLVGFELWATNNTGVANKFSAYVADSLSSLDSLSTRTEIEEHGILVLKDLPLKATGQTHITYGQSFKYIASLDKLKELAEVGKFKMFAVANESNINFNLDSVLVIVTFTAGT